MKKAFAILFLVFNYPVFSQVNEKGHVFNDTSLFFIRQADSLNPVHLSADELTMTEQLFKQAVKEFEQFQQRYADSLNPKKKKRRAQAFRLDSNQYFFQLVPRLNKENQKEVWISGVCRNWFANGEKKDPGYDREWKKNFIDGNMIEDGGSCFIYLVVNLTLKTQERLVMNGAG
jgi:hypothetical protein